MTPSDSLKSEKSSLEKPNSKTQSGSFGVSAMTKRVAWILSLSGAIPFLVLTLCLLALPTAHPFFDLAQDALKTYGAVILSFLGGIRWGLAMRNLNGETGSNILVAAVIPSLVGWFAIFLSNPYTYGLLALGFAGQGIWDVFAARKGVFDVWFSKLRITITIIVVACMILAFLATA